MIHFRTKIVGVISIGLYAAGATAGELLYNGIELPDPWPPDIRQLPRDPMPVPYLKAPPKVVPIDVGRQLFVDDFLIESTDLKRTFHSATIHPASPVVKPDRPWESKQEKPRDPPHAMPFSDGVWYDSDRKLFRMWYMAGFCGSTCYAESADGIRWTKPDLDVVPGTNIVQADPRDSTTIWLDHTDADSQRRFKMMRRDQKTRRHTIHFSPDGIHWGDGVKASKAPDRTAFFYNPFRKVWVMNVRGISYWDLTESVYDGYKTWFSEGEHRHGTPRFRRYREGKDFLVTAQSWPDGEGTEHLHDPGMWVWPDRLDKPRPDLGITPEIYHLDVVAYESLMLGMFAIWKGNPKNWPARDKICELQVGFSRDGFHWDRPWREPFVGVSEDPEAWNHSNLQPVGGCCLVVGDKLYFYVSGRTTRDITVHDGYCSTGLVTLRRDGFASMDAGATEGQLTTRPVSFRGKHLFVNAAVSEGELQAEILDQQGNVIQPFTRANCTPVRADNTSVEIRWKDVANLSAVSGKPVKLRFAVRNGSIYSFWVSDDASGASNGYVAAGGPAYIGPIDATGQSKQ